MNIPIPTDQSADWDHSALQEKDFPTRQVGAPFAGSQKPQSYSIGDILPQNHCRLSESNLEDVAAALSRLGMSPQEIDKVMRRLTARGDNYESLNNKNVST